MKTASFESKELDLPGVLLITPVQHEDARGFSMSAYDAEQFAELGITARFVQDYVSFSEKNVIRGFHYQKAPYAQDKLVRCATGRALDVIVDFDTASPTYGKHISFELDAAKGEMLYVPGPYGHGFCVLSDNGALVEYKIAGAYDPASASGIRYDDPTFAIAWPVANPVLSDKDKAWPMLSERTA